MTKLSEKTLEKECMNSYFFNPLSLSVDSELPVCAFFTPIED
jgi:hypothetical protein